MINTPGIATLLPPERLRESVVAALVDGRVLQTSVRGDAQPDDLAVQLLDTHRSGPVREAVLSGVRDVWILLQQAVVQPAVDPDAPIWVGAQPLSEVVSHFGALLNRAPPLS